MWFKLNKFGQADLSDWRKSSKLDLLYDWTDVAVRKIAIPVGFVTRWVFMVGAVLLVVWLSDIASVLNTPFGSLTPLRLLGALFGLVLCVGLVFWATRTGKKNYDLWAILLVPLVIGGWIVIKMYSLLVR